MNREDVAMDLTVQNVEILRGRLEQAEHCIREVAASLAWNCFGECRAVHDGPIMPAQGALEMARDFLASHQVEQCPQCDGSGNVSDSDGCGVWYIDCPSCSKKHPEQAEGAQGEREAFEAAMKQRLTEEGYPSMDLPALLELNGRGDYASTRINGAWIGWQARAAMAQPSPAFAKPSPLKDCDVRYAANASSTAVPGAGEHLLPSWRSGSVQGAQPSPEPCHCQLGNCLGAEEGRWCKAQPSQAPELEAIAQEMKPLPTEFAQAIEDNLPDLLIKGEPAPELDRPEVVAWLVTGVHPNHSAPHGVVDRNGQSAKALADHWAERGCAVEIMPLMTVAQHDRVVGALRAEVERNKRTIDGMNEAHAKLAGLYDAAQARVAELEKQEPIGKCLSESEMGIGFDRRAGPMIWFGTPKPGFIYAAPVAQAGQVPDEVRHWSDCATNNRGCPELLGPCDCGGYKEGDA